MENLIKTIQISDVVKAEEILKSAGTEDLFEKAKHNVGDMHPNGKWVWTQLPSGKFDWRVKKNNSSKTDTTDKPTTKQDNSKTADNIKPKQGELKTRDSVVKFAKNNNTFKNVKSGWSGKDAKAFELKIGQVVLRADFLNTRECIYAFENEDGDVLYDTADVLGVEEIDWDNLLNNTKNWLIDKKYKLKNNLESINKKVTAAKKKYDKTRKSDDFYKFASWERYYNGIQRSIKNLDELISMSE